jgi:hypothetical protein
LKGTSKNGFRATRGSLDSASRSAKRGNRKGRDCDWALAKGNSNDCQHGDSGYAAPVVLAVGLDFKEERYKYMGEKPCQVRLHLIPVRMNEALH